MISLLGFQLIRLSIRSRTGATTARWTGLRYICSEPWMGRGFNLLLGPPEVPRSTFTVNSYPDDTQDLDDIQDPDDTKTIRDILNEWFLDQRAVRQKKMCLTFWRRYIFFKHIKYTPTKKDTPDVVQGFLEDSWHGCPQTTLKLICLLRGTGRFSKESREDFYTAAIWLHRYHPETLAYNVGAFSKFGCLKDLLEILHRIINGPQVRHNQIMERDRVMKDRQRRFTAKRIMQRHLLHVLMLKKMNSKEIQIRMREQEKRMKSKVMQKIRVIHLRNEKRIMMSKNEKRIMMAKKVTESYNYDPKYRFLHDQISNLFAKLLKADLEYLISGQLTKISLASKWCPSLDSSYDHSTLLCESVARKLFPRESCPEYRGLDESHYIYRVRNRLRKEVLVPLRRALELPEIYMSAEQWNLVRYDRIASNAMRTYKGLFYKHDRDGFLLHLQNVQCPKMPKTTTKELLPDEVLSLLLGCDSGHEVADLQWKRMIDAYSSKGKFVNCISIIDASLVHGGYECTERFCLAFALMTSELCASPWRGKVLTYSTINNHEFVNIEGDDLGSRISFLRCLPMCDYPELIRLLDKILETAKDLKLCKENMIERIFVFDHCVPHRCFIGWRENYGEMREKYEKNGYVMPKIVYWYNHAWDASIEPCEVSDGGITGIIASEASFRNFVETNGTLSPMAVMEMKISSEDYLKLVVRD